MFPTGLGMNRGTTASRRAVRRVSHGSGDEPINAYRGAGTTKCSPRGGDEPQYDDRITEPHLRVSHERGDEPAEFNLKAWPLKCSPLRGDEPCLQSGDSHTKPCSHWLWD